MFSIEEYNYDLREDLIAQVPAPSRDGSRLLRVNRSGESISDHHFYDLPGLLKHGDLLVVNNTRVVQARIFGRKESGGRVEILVLEHTDPDRMESDERWCLLRASKRPGKGSRLFFEGDASGIVEEFGEGGLTRISFHGEPVDSLLDKWGCMPLPPYIKRDNHDGRSAMDRERYQTVFSGRKGAVAAPTAGLHFTEHLIEKLNRAGISLKELTLHVGHGTFRPVRTDDIREHELGEENYLIETDTADSINTAKREGRRVIAVGTTVVRTLESVARPNGEIVPGRGRTDLLITPGFRFKCVDGMVTNFHLPRSSLLFLVSAFGGMDLIRRAYKWAVEKEYRFYSYGDAMLIQ
ncbi:MAG: tRNA preQ1(34) S-adenosylmethionine ribosyltransferase-isomerase QueA [Deltaproteobacteria bacterium]|nr:tRNA preQ1(34) S-adenosylmethionine ribosyltransferase-isomerase QueA [Deltaproteobacteria bacterium]